MNRQSQAKRMQWASLATEAALSPVFGGIIGFLFDKRFGWSPWGLTAGVIAGGLVSIRLVIELIRKVNRNSE